MMNLSALISEFIDFDLDPKYDPLITGLSMDSRTVEYGNLFFACQGSKQEGSVYIEDAIQRGAMAILIDVVSSPKISLSIKEDVPIIFMQNLSQRCGEIAAKFYDYPSRSLKIIGITGTNGKTSCSHFIASTLNEMDYKCGIIGTLGYGLPGHLTHMVNTTPNAIVLQKLLAKFRDDEIEYVAIEVSSHGIAEGRIAGIEFTIGIFTNLTRDHLDYHGDMETYAKTKRKFFSNYKMQYAVINADDPYGKIWIEELQQEKKPVFAYSQDINVNTRRDAASVYVEVYHAQFDQTGITASLHTPWGDGVLHNSSLIGRFNLSNLLVTVTTLGILGFPLQDVLSSIANLRGVPGRMETFGGDQKPLVIVDYAHTPDALEQVLLVLREYEPARIWCVFGCGGDRDKGKRPQMGKIAEKYADQLVVTDDNPRHEDPKAIIADILQGLQKPENAVVEHDRRRAITHALDCARPGEIVLIAGKGHETYQIIGDNVDPFSDAFEVQLLLERK